jgi:hypothetical protein
MSLTIAPDDVITIVATTTAGRVHVELSDGSSILGVAESHAVTVRNRNGVISFDVQRTGSRYTHGAIF